MFKENNAKSNSLQIAVILIVLEVIFILAVYNIMTMFNTLGFTKGSKVCTFFVVLFVIASIVVLCYVSIRKNTNSTNIMGNDGVKIEYLTMHDTLTGLPNKAYLDKMAELRLSEAELAGKKLAAVFIGIDNFKQINDTLGHTVGDNLIKETAKRLFKLSDRNFEVVRFGGDEFVALISDYGRDEVVEEKINLIDNCFVDGFNILGQNIYMNASIGYAIYPEHANEHKMLLQYADMAMYNAKASGKNKCTVFKMDMNSSMKNRMLLEQKIVNAINEDKFEMYYQPQFDFRHNKFRGFEALIRWKDEDLGDISPAVFIPIAEEKGYIVELGEWILREVCKTWSDWKKEYKHKGIVSVNISAIQLTRPDFVDMVRNMTVEYGINPNELELEITETVLIDDIDNIIGTLNALKEIGVSLSLDDFGTGYSSLTYLRELPIDILKIDRSFITNITENNKQAEITDALIELVHKFNMETIAEGVETQEQYDSLRYMQCDNIQGFFTGRPMASADAAILLSNQCFA